MTRPTTLVLAMLAFAGLPLSASADAPAYVAKVNGVAISTGTFSRTLAEARATGQADTPELRRIVTQRLIAEELFWQEAQKLKLDKSPEATAAADQARRQSAIRQYVLRAAKPAEPSEADVKQRYEQIVANLGPREYRISLIQTPDEPALREAAKRVAEGGDFAAEAKRVSKAPSAARGGELDWVSFPVPPAAGHTNGLPVDIAQAIVNLSPGQVSAPIRIEGSWAVVRLDAQRPTLIPPFEQVSATVRQAARVQAADTAGRTLGQEVLRKAHIETPAGNTPAKEVRP